MKTGCDAGERRVPLKWLLIFSAVHFLSLLVFVLPGDDQGRSLWGQLPQDDAWIHLVYGRAILSDAYPAYNDSEPETGFTSPLWAVFAAVAHLPELAGLEDSAPVAIKIIGVLLALLLSWLAAGLLLSLGSPRWLALVAGLWLALDPEMIYAKLSGMEIVASAVFVLWGIIAVHRKKWLRSGVFLALAVAARPENVFMPFAVAGLEFLYSRFRIDLKKSLALLVPTACLVLAWVLYCLMATGYPLPNTALMKAMQNVEPLLSVMALVKYFWASPTFAYGAGLALLTLGVWSGIANGDENSRRTWRLVYIYVAIFSAGIVASRSLVGPDIFYQLRYIMPVFPFLILIMARALPLLADAVKLNSGRDEKTALASLKLYGSFLLIGVYLIVFSFNFAFQLSEYGRDCGEVTRMNVDAGKWIAANTPEDALVATADAGAIRYFGVRRTIDLLGLNTHEVARSELAEEFFKRNKIDYFFIYANRPPFAGLVKSPNLESVWGNIAKPSSVLNVPELQVGIFRVKNPDLPFSVKWN